jgi:hypothetical protein
LADGDSFSGARMAGSNPVTRNDPVTGQELRIGFESIDQLSHADALVLLDYWRDCRKAGAFVMGRHVPARAIARLTKHLVVLEPTTGPADFKYRLAGAVLLQRLGRDVTGLTISDVFDAEPARSLIAAARKVIETDAPVFQRIHVRGVLADVRRPELVLLPMSAPDGTTAWVLIGVFYHEV